MVEIYTTPSCSSCRKAKKWLDEYSVKYTEKNLLVTKLTREDIKYILEKTENGFEDIVSTRSKAFKDNDLDINEMSMNQLLDFILKNPSVLRRPIIVDKYRLQVGYNDEEIRTFLPREYRNSMACSSCEKCNCSYLKALERALQDNFIESQLV